MAEEFGVEGGVAASLALTTDGFSDFWKKGFLDFSEERIINLHLRPKEESNEFFPTVSTCLLAGDTTPIGCSSLVAGRVMRIKKKLFLSY